jgi:carbonic anhydrase
MATAGSLLVSVAIALPVTAQSFTHDPEGNLGPERWGELGPDYRTCGSVIEGLGRDFHETGKKQSPIDISGAANARLPKLMFHYGESSFEVENTGHVIEVSYEPGSVLMVGSESYTLLQFHFHAPSEHTLDGRSYPMELHLVHSDALGNLAVVGVLLELGTDPNELAAEIFANAPREEGVADVDGRLDALDLLPVSRGYYTYAGSLTTPPCTEGVRWFVLRRAVQIDEETVDLFHEIIGAFEHYEGFENNNRPVRPLNGRPVLTRR